MIDKKILITGSAGFIGSHLVDELTSKNKVIGLNTVTENRKKNYLPIRKDITKLTDNTISGYLDGLIHLAAITDVDFCNKNPHKCIITNVLGTQNALEAARKKDCKFLFLSTAHVYGMPKKIPIREDHPKNPTSIYSASKIASEVCCEGYSKTYGMNVSVIRLFSVYGPRSPSHLVTSRIVSQFGKKSIKLGNLYTKRDFVYISDVIRAIVTVFSKSKNFNVYNVGSGQSHSILQIYEKLTDLSGSTPLIQSIKSKQRMLDIKELRADISKIKRLGWKPMISFSQGLQILYEWHLLQK